MNTPGFTANASLYRTMRHFRSLPIRGESRQNNEVISQVSKDKAEWIRSTLGFGRVDCTFVCAEWRSCGYEEYSGKTCCTWGYDDCVWRPF
jgi:hypothetical protein